MANPDFYSSTNYNGYVAFTEVDMGDTYDVQSLVNESDTATLLVSFDGTNTHAVLRPDGPTKAYTWDDHPRRSIWLKKSGGTGTSHGYILMAFKEAGDE